MRRIFMDKQNIPENTEDKIVFCKRCGRKLVGSDSKLLGFGPTCYRLWKKERNQQMPVFETTGDHNE